VVISEANKRTSVQKHLKIFEGYMMGFPNFRLDLAFVGLIRSMSL